MTEENQFEERETYEAKRKELEDLWNPIAVKMYAQKTEQTNETTESKEQPAAEPTVEEVD